MYTNAITLQSELHLVILSHGDEIQLQVTYESHVYKSVNVNVSHKYQCQ